MSEDIEQILRQKLAQLPGDEGVGDELLEMVASDPNSLQKLLQGLHDEHVSDFEDKIETFVSE